MPASAIKVRRTRRLAVARWRCPAGTLHLVDIENLAGAAIPSLVQVMDVQDRYARSLAVGVDDQVVMAASHLGLVNAAVGWPHARYRVRSGPNGADLELLDVIWHEDVATRFNHVVIGSGDGTFVTAAQALSDGGIWVTVVSRWGSLSGGPTRGCRPRTRWTGRTRYWSTGTSRRPRRGWDRGGTRSPGGRR